MRKSIPIVTIGVPVHNASRTLGAALESLINQTFRDFILVISDNASTDGTDMICREYAARDDRILYVRQKFNIGAERNFKFVFDHAHTEYFMWAAADDIRSLDFIANNISFLDANPDYLASTSPVRFVGREFNELAMGDGAIHEDSSCERIAKIFRCWHANGRFYSIFRTDAVASWSYMNNSHFLGSDWTLIIHLASKGKLHRHSEGWVELGVNGVSNSTDIFARYRKTWLDWILPFHKISGDAFVHISSASLWCKFRLMLRLVILNGQAFRGQFFAMAQRRRASM